MNVERSTTPKEIKYNHNLMDDPSEIELKSSSKLKSIDIYSHRDTQSINTESDTLYSTVFDHSIVFNLKNGDVFCISADTGMTDSTVVSYDNESLQILLNDKTKRLTI